MVQSRQQWRTAGEWWHLEQELQAGEDQECTHQAYRELEYGLVRVVEILNNKKKYYKILSGLEICGGCWGELFTF